jgi:WD40 repeat protein
VNGANVITWLDSDTLVAGCLDHAIKIVDIEKTFLIKQSIMTDYKVPTCIDSSEKLVLVGCEDAVLRLYDTRSGSKMASQYVAHDRYVTGVKFNSLVQNVFISSSIDGTVRLWDLRNSDVPLANLKHKTAEACEDFKIFGLEWNGASQILSGGSDSHVSVHSM